MCEWRCHIGIYSIFVAERERAEWFLNNEQNINEKIK